MNPEPVPLPTEFEWQIYADATFAGLSVLIPIPLIDLAFEQFFRRRMIKMIARRRGRVLETAVVRELNRNQQGCRQGCFTMVPKLVFDLLKRLSRKIFYFLTVKEATDQLSLYWHRAFLLDYMMAVGYLTATSSNPAAIRALETMVSQPDISPLNQLSAQIVGSVRHIFRTLRHVRRGQEDEVVAETRSLMRGSWGDFTPYWQELAAEFDQQVQIIADQLAANGQQDGDVVDQA